MIESLPKNIKALIKERGISQSVLAENIGVSKGTMSDWLSGRYYPRAKYIEAMADYFKVDAAELQMDKEKSQSSIDDRLVHLFESLTDDKKEQVLDFIDFLHRSRK